MYNTVLFRQRYASMGISRVGSDTMVVVERRIRTFVIANETYPLMRTIPSLKEKTMFAGISAIAIAIAALAGEYYVVALTQEH